MSDAPSRPSSFAEPGFALPGLGLGVATAATQIEGGNADTNWHRWAAKPGRIADGSTPARAADHWERVGQDIALLGELGVKHYRMGLEWARLEPRPGEFDTAAVAHYRDELTRLRQAGIRPLVTLHHFNNPWWFERVGGWESPSALPTFARYVTRVLEELGDLVDDWVTINEPNVYATKGWLDGQWPPGVTNSFGRTLTVMQVMATAHVQTYQAIHAAFPQAQVGVANHLRVFAPQKRWNPVHQLSATSGRYLFQAALTRAFSQGRFLAPFVQPKGVEPGRYYDFQGINYYTRSSVKGLADGVASHVPVNDLGWEIYPQGLVEVARWTHQHYPGPIWITENGTADAADRFRSRFLYDHLRAIAGSGLPIERFYHWCFTDNFEWAEGEEPRFGLVALDYLTQQRTVRDSGRFYADVIAHGGVTAQAHARWVAGQAYPR
ncbi:MAG: family 1 glycosylhydrolase [Propionicimonas sp.]|uniref:glycoside hydrolase family 1 protein n=1 Tax=Propionicimonas sp. TaxID=1955623 RepID=UPI002B21023A|nr:family 1 glycosylhydrolase [Propionicimonas sp.]MEA4944761.1 family 1 glycosylhydrolase [Propionicimonas sp.]MEA5053705.1 family 1 glycosylhydrolase [Propionicimonas sp.]MEA5118183.1 family 1 glycosylhydrolase [Propionicimonas sp.]